MFCPKCRAEFREEFTQCDECGVDLVREAPPEPELAYDEFREVLSLYDPEDIAMVKSLLDSQGIKYYLHGEEFHRLFASTVGSTKLMVQKDDVKKAVALLKDLQLESDSPAENDSGENS
jgi:hypothetical protein